MLPQSAVDGFREVFGALPQVVVRAPGRVNLVGDHTDYSGGLVLPMAIDRSLTIAIGDSPGESLCIRSAAYPDQVSLAASDLVAGVEPAWVRPIVGVIALLRESGIAVRGLRVHVSGDLPIGAGLASSAAVEVGVARAVLALRRHTWDEPRIARLCQRAEHEFAQSPCGIMDQLCCLMARRGEALQVDCASMAAQWIPLAWERADQRESAFTCASDAVLVVIDSGVSHSNAGGEYAERRRELGEALAELQRLDPSVRSLRNVSPNRLPALLARLGELSPAIARRARHVVSENGRVEHAAAALRAGDLVRFGELLTRSHVSLRDDFEVSSRELDAIVDAALSCPGVLGARMTGGGFGGCAIVLIERRGLTPLLRAIRELGTFGTAPAFFLAGSADGASILP